MYRLIISLCFLLVINSLFAQTSKKKNQDNRFNAALVLGTTLSQMDGDAYRGYNKTGFLGGLRGEAKLNSSSHLAIEMLFSQRGSRDPNEREAGIGIRYIQLNYVEVPVLYHFELPSFSEVLSFEAGFSFSRLINFQINENPSSRDYLTFTAIKDGFNQNEFAWLAGGIYHLSDHFQVKARYAHAVTFLYDQEAPANNFPPIINNLVNVGPTQLEKLRSFYWSIGVNYLFL